ncbi:hypothetical protein BpHYR1_003065 [Brachionus plicatilis]|uniref:Uncharacterized protein n=1 Tax=Brachionus plicatilis TaxID=10195 RepID=A0A3M7SEL6_BRAPC|nr:hypothetical protein BpHYR1_003065 [Brachionus plicatilis]
MSTVLFGDLPPQAYPSGMNPLFSLHIKIQYLQNRRFILKLAGHLSFGEYTGLKSSAGKTLRALLGDET